MMRMLDLFAGEGGAAEGYRRAGFAVVGVDLYERFRRRYPGTYWQGDVLDVIQWSETLLRRFDLIHASPPCQHASAGTRAGRSRGRQYPALIEPVREALVASGRPYVIENVSGSALRDPVTLCGTMFGLAATDDDGTLLHLRRHRLFETSWPVEQPACQHEGVTQWAGSYGGARRDKHEARNVRHGGYVPSRTVQQQLLGIDWMTQAGMYQSVPPAYTEWVGRRAMAHLETVQGVPA